jgi:peptidoglycan/LPS O-acetylase OafA/YrhL
MVKYNKRHVLAFVSVLFVCWFGAKLVAYIFLGKGITYRILGVTQFDCMMLGAMGAIMYYRKTEWFCNLCANRFVVIIAWVLFFSSGIYADYIPSSVRNEFIALISLLVIMAGLLRKPILENRVMNYLGQISYGIYVIHPLLLYVLTRLIKPADYMPNEVASVVIFATMTVLTIVLAGLSYKYFEMPFLRLKSRFSVVQSTNSKN